MVDNDSNDRLLDALMPFAVSEALQKEIYGLPSNAELNQTNMPTVGLDKRIRKIINWEG